MSLWDPQKAIINFEKHSIAFEEAAMVFADPDALDWEDQAHSELELRMKRLGRGITRIILVVYTLRRGSDGKEKIRIISVPQANRKERFAYTRQSN